MASDDDYAPAITDTVTDEAGAESTITTRAPDAATAPVLQAGEAGDDPSQPPGRDSRGQRVISDKTRAMFRQIAASAAKAEASEMSGIADDLVPMISDDPPPAAAVAAVAGAPVASPAAGVTSPPAAAATAAPIAPPPPIPPPPPAVDVGKAAAEQAKLLHDLRDKQLADREAALAERERQLPNRSDLIERPGATLAAYLREVYGPEDDAAMKDVIADIVTELSETGLGVKLPADVKSNLEARKALRSVRAYKADLTKQQASLAEQRAAQDKTAAEEREKQETVQRERQAVSQVSALLADPAVRAAHKFLHDSELTGGSDPASIVVEVVKEQIKAGQPANWQVAARWADDHFKSQAEALAKKSAHLHSLLAPAAPVAPAKAAASPGGVPGPAPKPQPLPTATVINDATTTDTDEPVMDRRDRRAQSLRKLAAKHKVLAT